MRKFAQKAMATQQTKSAKSMKPTRLFSRRNPDAHSILYLQHIIVNRSVQRLLQAKFTRARSMLQQPALRMISAK